MSQRLRSTALLGATAVAILAACTGGAPKPRPVPDVILSTTTVTTLPDLSSETLPGIAGVTTAPPVLLTPGRAALNGTVVDDTGSPVPGATIGLERIVGSQVGQSSVVAGADGTWVAQGIIGGIYRVRAWRAPDLASTQAQTLYLPATGTQTLNLTVTHVTGLSVQSSVAPNPPIIGEPANVVVEVTGATVGSDGFVRSEGQPGIQLDLVASGSWSVRGDGTAVTSSSGFAGWEVTCEALGAQSLSVVVNGGQSYGINVGPCSPVPTTTTTTTPPSTTTTQPDHRHGRTTTTL